MKEIKYIVGLAAVLAVITTSVLGILKIVNETPYSLFYEENMRILSVIGIAAVAAIVISLIANAFKSK